MRITFPVASSGDAWWPFVPQFDAAQCYRTDDDGECEFDENAFRRAMKNERHIMFASTDTPTICAFASLLLDTLNKWTKDITVAKDDSHRAKRIQRRVATDRYATVRVDILPHVSRDAKNHLVTTAKVRIREDARKAIGQNFQHLLALYIADVCNVLEQKAQAHKEHLIDFTPELQALVDELHERSKEEA